MLKIRLAILGLSCRVSFHWDIGKPVIHFSVVIYQEYAVPVSWHVIDPSMSLQNLQAELAWRWNHYGLLMRECICFVMQADLVEYVVAHAVQHWFQWCFTHWWNQTHFRASLNQATCVGVTSMLSPGCFADFWQSASKVLCLEGYVQGAGGCNHYPLGILRRLLNIYLHHCWELTKSLGSNGSL